MTQREKGEESAEIPLFS